MNTRVFKNNRGDARACGTTWCPHADPHADLSPGEVQDTHTRMLACVDAPLTATLLCTCDRCPPPQVAKASPTAGAPVPLAAALIAAAPASMALLLSAGAFVVAPPHAHATEDAAPAVATTGAPKAFDAAALQQQVCGGWRPPLWGTRVLLARTNARTNLCRVCASPTPHSLPGYVNGAERRHRKAHLIRRLHFRRDPAGAGVD
jgi:hypothetical protein